MLQGSASVQQREAMYNRGGIEHREEEAHVVAAYKREREGGLSGCSTRQLLPSTASGCNVTPWQPSAHVTAGWPGLAHTTQSAPGGERIGMSNCAAGWTGNTRCLGRLPTGAHTSGAGNLGESCRCWLLSSGCVRYTFVGSAGWGRTGCKRRAGAGWGVASHPDLKQGQGAPA